VSARIYAMLNDGVNKEEKEEGGKGGNEEGEE
jgi:hypothetical protein